MKPGILLVLLAAAAAMAQTAEFQAGRIELRYDGLLHARLRWQGDRGRNILDSDPSAQPGLEANGWEAVDFRLDPRSVSRKRINDAEFGPALECAAAGRLRDERRDLQMERRIRVLLPDKFPDTAIFDQAYRNLGGRRVHLGRVWSQRLVLDRRLAEPAGPSWALASFQGGAYAWGRDYALVRLAPGFHQL